jgi:hypothetical protein
LKDDTDVIDAALLRLTGARCGERGSEASNEGTAFIAGAMLTS